MDVEPCRDIAILPEELYELILNSSIAEPYDAAQQNVAIKLCLVCKYWATIILEEIIPANIHTIEAFGGMILSHLFTNCEKLQLESSILCSVNVIQFRKLTKLTNLSLINC